MEKKKLNPEQGKRLKECLEDRRMSQKELAEKSGYTTQYISNIVVGKKNMSLESAEIFASILEVKKDYLLCKTIFKTHEEQRKRMFSSLDTINNVVLSLLKLFGIEITERILKTKEGEIFSGTDFFPLIIDQKAVTGKKIEINGEIRTVDTVIMRTMIDGVQKDIPYDELYLLQKEIIDYTEFMCNRFKKDPFNF